MKNYLLLLICILGYGHLSAQRIFQSGPDQIELQHLIILPSRVDYLTPVSNTDGDLIRLFKQYFNPVSFETYRSFFLPQDWPGSSQEDFLAWQSHLKQNQMWLEAVLRLKDQHGNAFAILQYTFESESYVLPNSAVFKLIGGHWKHISLPNDMIASTLKKIGSLQTGYLASLPAEFSMISLDMAIAQQARASREKFSRHVLFEKLQAYYQAKSMTEADIQLARKLFTDKNEMDMVFHLAAQYNMDAYDLMSELNSVLGFSMFRFIQPGKVK